MFVAQWFVERSDIFTVSSFVRTWVGAVFIGGLLVPPRGIAYIWHVIEQRNRPRSIESPAVPLAPNPPGASPTAGSSP
ncbi:MAG TPA: hypothetical protein VGP82_05115 [Ktedonobacterales bacterium]|nr:hypothetical protein [Ktedonobacterales bacterium]